MDILSDILHVAGLRRRLLDLHGLTPEAALRFPCERSFGLHAVTRGRAFVHAPNLDQPLELADVPENLVKDIDRLRKKANEEAMTTLTKHLMKELEAKYVREKAAYRAKLEKDEAQRLR